MKNNYCNSSSQQYQVSALSLLPSFTPQVSGLSPQPSLCPQVSGLSPQPSLCPQVSGLSPQPSLNPQPSFTPQVSGLKSQPSEDVLVRVQNVSKKFCRDLKKSLWYGMKDLGGELMGRGRDRDELRPEEFWAVKDISFELKRGECLGLIGRNGAGKTTLLRMLNGLIKPDKGRIEMRGRVGALIALGAGFNPILTGRENIYVNAAVLGLSKKETDEKFDEIVDFAELGDFIDAPVQSYSSGMQVRLGFAIATALKPDILLMDEILAVGDMSFQTKCFNKIAELREVGVASILVSHNMHHISRFCDLGLFLKSGEVASINTVKSSISSYLSKKDVHQLIVEKKSDICSSDKIRINKAYFVNEFGKIIDETYSEKQISIKIPYIIENDSINDPIIEIVLRLNDGTPFIQFTTKKFNNCIGILAKSGEISIMIESLPANNITLYLSVAIWERNNSNLLFWQKGHPSLFVIGDPLSIGIVNTQFSVQHTLC